MDFSTEFIALRDRMAGAMQKDFVCRENYEIGGRMAALYSSFGVTSERKLLGLVGLGNSGHAHEYRALFAAPSLDEKAMEDWWQYALSLERQLVEPDRDHVFSIVSVILVTEGLEKPLQKQLRKLNQEHQFKGEDQAGWSSIRFAVADLGTRKVFSNRFGEPLKNVVGAWL